MRGAETVLLTLCLWLTALAHGQEVIKDPHRKGLLSGVHIGARFSSVLENRGVILYRDFQIDPVVAILFLDDRVEFLGDSLGFRDFVAGTWLRWRTRLVSLTDKPLFPAWDAIKAGSPLRPDTYEWANSLEVFIPGYNDKYRAEIDLTFAKDISIHHGHYLELQSKLKLFDFSSPFGKVNIEPNIFASVGWGDHAHNLYFYGSGAPAGVNNVAYGLWFAFPEKADRYYPIVQFRRFQTVGKNSRAAFANGPDEGWLVSFIASVSLWN